MAAQSKQTRVAIIGTGGIAAAHAQGLKSLAERVEVVGAVDVDRARVEEFCTQQGFDKNIAYTDTARMLAEQRPRLVNVCTPPGLHCDQSIQAMEAGAWVLCEKPLCASLEELDRLAEAERRTGQYVSSVYQWRFGSGGRHLKKLVEAGSLGKPLVGMCNTTWYRGDDYYAVPWRGKWATELGGPTMIHGIHAMDFFLWVMGDWAEVRAMIGTLDRRINVEDVSMAMVRFENGAMGSVVNSILCPNQVTHIRWDFQKATTEVSGLYGYANADWTFTPAPALKDSPELARW
ncbi:MAG: Gfo/Idh/MocA family protein, partial [Tepidisphaeraceae bacterium]